MLFARLGGAAANVGAVLILGRALSPGEVGIVLTAMAAAQLAELGATLGREEVAVQAVPQALAAGDLARASSYLRSTARQAAWLAPPAALAAALALHAVAGARVPIAALALTAALVPAMTALRVLCRTGQAAGEVERGALCLLLVRPSLFAAGLAALWASGALSVTTALGAALAAAVLAVAAQAAASRRALGFVRAPPSAPDPGWRTAGLGLLLTVPMLGEFTSVVTLISSVVLAEAEVAVLGVALRYAGLVAMGSGVMIAVLGPRLSGAWSRDRPGALRTGRTITAVSAPLTLLAVLLVWALASPLMGLFGDAYRAGAWPLRVLVLMPLTGAVVGPCLLVLTAAGRPGQGARSAALGLVCVALGILVGARFGLTGTALGTLAGFAAWQASLAVRLARAEGVWLGVPLGARRAPARP